MEVEYTLEPEDIGSARLLAVGIRPRVEFALFALVVTALLACSVTPWTFATLPLLTGLIAGLGAYRLMQINKVRDAALAAYRRNPTLRRSTAAAWDDGGVTIRPAGALQEHIPWSAILRLRENERIVLLVQGGDLLHAIPKRAFTDKALLAAFRVMAARHKRIVGA